MTTSSLEQVQQIPTSEVLLYVATTFMKSHYTVTRGVGEIQQGLIAKVPAENLHMSTSVHMVKFGDYNKKDAKAGSTNSMPKSFDGSTNLHLITCHSQSKQELVYKDFDHVIFATPASRSALILDATIECISEESSEVTRSLREVGAQLEQVLYEKSTVINHTDDSLMPPSRRDWRDLNLVTSTHFYMEGRNKSKRNHTMATHACQRLHDGRYAFQTTNALIAPHPSSILSTSTFPRALTTPKYKIEGLFQWRRTPRLLPLDKLFPAWQLDLGPLQRHNCSNLFFCGSYSQGIPLLEGCVTSSALVVSEIFRRDSSL